MTDQPALREQITGALRPWLLGADEPDVEAAADAVLAVILPHGKFLGDQLRDSEQRLTETRTALYEVLSHFVHKGHPGEPCLSSGWISEKTVARWRNVLYPPAPAHDAGPTVAEAKADDQRWWGGEKTGEQ